MVGRRWLLLVWAGVVLVSVAGCEPAVQQVLPTERPTITLTATASATPTPGADDPTPTVTRTRAPATVTGGPSPTSLLGATSTPNAVASATRSFNPNAPRIEFFTSDVQAVSPGSDVTLFWSTRGAAAATIYRLDPTGARNQLWNVASDGSLTVRTGRNDRGTVDFVLSVGDGTLRTEQRLSLPLSCPVTWFFVPPPVECPNEEAIETTIQEQPFVRGRMLYIAEQNRVYALFNDELQPAWVSFENRYDPFSQPESIEGLPVPPGQFQPIAILGLVWRGNDRVRSRLGLGIQPEFDFEGFTQTASAGADGDSLFISSSDGSVLQLLPQGESWQIIALR